VRSKQLPHHTTHDHTRFTSHTMSHQCSSTYRHMREVAVRRVVTHGYARDCKPVDLTAHHTHHTRRTTNTMLLSNRIQPNSNQQQQQNPGQRKHDTAQEQTQRSPWPSLTSLSCCCISGGGCTEELSAPQVAMQHKRQCNTGCNTCHPSRVAQRNPHKCSHAITTCCRQTQSWLPLRYCQ
jgi:hypothetical protein